MTNFLCFYLGQRTEKNSVSSNKYTLKIRKIKQQLPQRSNERQFVNQFFRCFISQLKYIFPQMFPVIQLFMRLCRLIKYKHEYLSWSHECHREGSQTSAHDQWRCHRTISTSISFSLRSSLGISMIDSEVHPNIA